MLYSIPYLALLVFFGVSAYVFEHSDEQRKARTSLLACVVFFVFFAFRGYVYTDWIAYYEFFNDCTWGTLFDWDVNVARSYEPGYVILNMLCKTIVDDYLFLTMVVTAIDFALFLRFLKRREIENISFVFMLFVSFSGLGLMFNLVRNSLSIFIFLNALEYIEERKPLQYFGMCLLAFSFHMSAVLFFPLYFFLHIRFNRWVLLGVFVGCLVFYFSNISIVLTAAKLLGLEETMSMRLQAYTEHYTSARALSITGTFEKTLLVGLLFFYYDEIMERFKRREVMVNSLMLYLMMYYLLSEFTTLSSRFAMLFVFCYWVLWIDVVKILFIENNRKVLMGFLFMYFAYMTAVNINTPCHEYDNLLFGAKSYEERLMIFNSTYQESE